MPEQYVILQQNKYFTNKVTVEKGVTNKVRVEKGDEQIYEPELNRVELL